MAHAAYVAPHPLDMSSKPPSVMGERCLGGDGKGWFVVLKNEKEVEAAGDPIAFIEGVMGQVIALPVETGKQDGRLTYQEMILLCRSVEPLTPLDDELQAEGVAEAIRTLISNG